MRSFGLLLDSSAIRGENMKHSDYKKETSPTTGVARLVYTTVRNTQHYATPNCSIKTSLRAGGT